MRSYYIEKLSGERLLRCYKVASLRVMQYLNAEIEFVLDSLQMGDSVLELGCGYGRVTHQLPDVVRLAVGIDNSVDSLRLAMDLGGASTRCCFLGMDALRLGFPDEVFDSVICLQNGICSFRVDPESLLLEALRVTRPGGTVLFSTYADEFWPYRLEWFEAQSAEGLVGVIDYAESRDGVIACKDGFRSGRLTPQDLKALCSAFDHEYTITEVDGSSVFCRIRK
jgi:2-polyprenyl-6-hydroxyphenyl methylase/3-demethylubiquinone-9 3-methyltransferase